LRPRRGLLRRAQRLLWRQERLASAVGRLEQRRARGQVGSRPAVQRYPALPAGVGEVADPGGSHAPGEGQRAVLRWSASAPPPPPADPAPVPVFAALEQAAATRATQASAAASRPARRGPARRLPRCPLPQASL